VLALALVIGATATAAAQTFTLTIQPNTIPAVTQGVAYNQAITAVGGNPNYSLAITSGALPPGINLTGGAGNWALTGTSNSPGSYSFTITATDIDGNTGFRPYTFSIGNAGGLTITSPASPLPNGTINVAYGSQTLTASGGNGNYTFTLNSGSLPAGMTLSAGGVISGTPTNGGTFNFQAGVSDTAGNTGAKNYVLHIGTNSLALSPPTLPNGTQFTPYSATVTASGGSGSYTFSISGGALPAGLSMDAAGNITGTPTGTGPSTFTVRAVDTFNNFATKQYTVTIGSNVLTLSPNSLPGGVVGTGYSQTISASGGAAPYTFAVTAGTLPTGLTLTASGAQAGTLSGTPSAAGTFNFTVQATDPSFNTGSKAYSVTIAAQPLVVGPASLAPGTLGTPYNQSVTASGGTQPYNFTLLSGSLPNGLNLNPNTGAITGTPSATGSFTFTVQVTDQTPTTGTKQFTINIGSNILTLTPPPLPAGTRNSPYSATITASGGSGSYTFAVSSGSLPAGLSLSSSGDITGTPTTAGQSNFTIRATDTLNNTGSQAYTVNIGTNSLTVTPPTLPPGTQGAVYSQTLGATGATGAVSYTLTSGALPTGLTLSGGGTISGTPSTTGSFAFSVQATDSVNNTGSQAYNIIIGGNVLTFTPTTLPNGTQNTPYSSGVTASGGNGSYTYSLASGSLPTGLSLNANSGAITGTPTGSGASNFTLRAIDTVGNTGTSNLYTINIGTISLTVNPATLPAATQNVPYSQTVSATGGTGSNYTFTISAGVLPTGLTLDSNSGLISGTPTGSGATDFTVQARDPMGNVGTRRYQPNIGTASLTLNPPTLPAAVMGKAYRQQLTVIGGTAPFTFTLTSGALPAGITLNASTGLISGTPTALGPASFTVQVRDINGNTGTRQYSITNRPDPALDPEVQGLVAAQVATAQRFATAQVANVGRHLDSLHDRFNPCTVNFGIAPPIEQGIQMQQPYGGQQYYAPQGYPPQTYANPSQLYSPNAQYGAPAAPPPYAPYGAPRYAPAPARFPGATDCASDWMSNASIWTAGAFQFGSMTPTGLTANNKFVTAGLTAGADLRLSERLIVGAALGYGADRSDIGSNGTRSDATSLSGSLYASLRVLDRVFLDGVLGYGSLGFDNKRWVAGDSALVNGKRSGSYWFGALTASLELRRGNSKLAPYVRADYISASLDGYSEQGPSAQLLTYDAMKVNAMSGAIGLRGSIDIPTSFGTLTPTARVEYRQTSQGAYNQALYYSDLGSGLGSTLAQSSNATGVTTGAVGLQARAAGGLTAEIEYALSNGGGALTAQTIRAALRLPF